MKYYRHKDWKNTACPGKYSSMMGKLVKDVNAEHAARKRGGTTAPKPSKPAPSKPSKPKPSGKAPGGTSTHSPYEKGGYIGRSRGRTVRTQASVVARRRASSIRRGTSDG